MMAVEEAHRVVCRLDELLEARGMTLTALADEWRAARERERAAMAALTGAILYAAGEMSQAEIVTATQVNRMTVRKALGL